MCYLVDDGVEGVGDLRLGARAALGREPVDNPWLRGANPASKERST